MASETDGAVRGYLYRALADGARPFSYRGRVRALLGLPEPGGVQMNFPKPLPVAGLAYFRPRLTGEFDFPDELLALSPHSAARRDSSRIEDSELAVRHTRRLDDNSSFPQDPVVPGSALPQLGKIGTEEPDRTDRQVAPARPRAADRFGNPLKRRDVVIPDAQGQSRRG